MQIKLLVEGGGMQPGPALSQKLGPTGIKINDVLQKVNEATKNFKGMKLPVELDLNISTKEIHVKVFSPPVSELLKRELGLPKGSGTQKKLYAGNASIEQIISVSKTKLPNMLCKDLKSAVKTVVGSCVSLGVLVENKPAVETEKDIDAGKYDKEISQEKTEASPEKKEKIRKYFEEVKASQEKTIKQEEAAKAAAAAAPAAEGVAATTTEAAKTGAAKTGAATTPTKDAKKEEPKKEAKKK